MIREEVTDGPSARRAVTGAARMLLALKLDGPLLVGLGLIAAYGLVVLYSASGQSLGTVIRQVGHLGMGTVAMLLLAQVNPNFLRRLSPWLYLVGVLLLFVVAGMGVIGKGAQRWLDLGILRFQPSEIMKLAVPMMCAWYLHERPLPPSTLSLVLLTALIMVPAGLVVMQPDLGTGALIAVGGALVVVMAGLQASIILGLIALAG
ncbi:MAG TPA: FtsW/RodA/SpoVE family cell cycle protein, partial [Steroidobacteraceae bacterium]|nr:FtsW/RodA/SpoVE family cell cycle protein [Steroidobacteraceae bacterium]